METWVGCVLIMLVVVGSSTLYTAWSGVRLNRSERDLQKTWGDIEQKKAPKDTPR